MLLRFLTNRSLVRPQLVYNCSPRHFKHTPLLFDPRQAPLGNAPCGPLKSNTSDTKDIFSQTNPLQPPTIGGSTAFDDAMGFFFRAVRWTPHPDKARTGGEDAYLSTDYVLGVADGVGWWNQLVEKTAVVGQSASKVAVESATDNQGRLIDPKTGEPMMTPSQQYSESLMRAAFDFCETEYLGSGDVPVLDLVKYAYGECSECEMGSTTALFVSLRGALLDVYCLGDSGMRLIRNNAVHFATEEQSHSINFPYQLGVGSKDKPSDGVVTTLPVRSGDIVILGSDGVFDNVFDEDILEAIRRAAEKYNRFRLPALCADDTQYQAFLVEERRTSGTRAIAGENAQRIMQAAADEIIALARSNANDPRSSTPFASKCIEAGAFHEGGKMDDMTLVLATITHSFIAEGARFGSNDYAVDLPAPYKNWP